jgi:hypothetical protein
MTVKAVLKPALAACLSLSLGLLLGLQAQAQISKAEDSAKERAQRQADNPLRLILEARKSRHKGEAEPPDAPRPVAKAPVAVAASRQAAPNPVASTAPSTAPPTVAFTSASATAATPAANPGPAVMSILAPPAPSTVPVAALAPSGVVANGVTSTLNALTKPSLSTDAATPKLVSMVEPSVPQRFFDEIGKRVEVVMDLSLSTDGTVAEVRFVPPVPRGAQRAMQSAVEQWRFSPLREPTVHRVVAVLNAPEN